MSGTQKSFWLFRLNKKIHSIIMLEPIINWSLLKKSALMMVLGLGLNLEWFLWKLFLAFSPEYWKWIDVGILHEQLFFNFFVILFFAGVLFLGYAFHHKSWTHKYIPAITGITLSVSVCVEAVMIGVMSPANIATYMCFANIILILFSRSYVYFFLIACAAFNGFYCYLNLFQSVEYDYLFTIHSSRFTNSFWLSCMIGLITPVVIFSIAFSELLLNQWRASEKIIQQMSQKDALTNLFNRRAINSTLEKLKLHQNLYSVVIVDLDFFKQVNDEYGHHTGDEVLTYVAQLLKNTIPPQHTAGRLGGEEFILILPNTEAEEAYQIAERCRVAIEASTIMNSEGSYLSVTASFGVSVSEPNVDYQKILDQADKALYTAKRMGRNQVQIWS